MDNLIVTKNVIPMPVNERTWPNSLRESVAIADVAKALHLGTRHAAGLPVQEWDRLTNVERLAFLDAATLALRGVTHEQRQLAEYVGALHVAGTHDVDWFALTTSQQMSFLYGARDAITASGRFLRGVAHPVEVQKARRARQLLRDKWDAQDRAQAQAVRS